MDFSSIQDIDFQILQWFNGSNNVILDQLVMALTSGFTWIPLYLVLFIIVMRNNETIGQIGLIVGCAFLCILFADGIAEGIIKPLAARWRPSNDPLVKYSVQIVDNLRLKDYSFCSAHAANSRVFLAACKEQDAHLHPGSMVAGELLDPPLSGRSLSAGHRLRYAAGHGGWYAGISFLPSYVPTYVTGNQVCFESIYQYGI